MARRTLATPESGIPPWTLPLSQPPRSNKCSLLRPPATAKIIKNCSQSEHVRTHKVCEFIFLNHFRPPAHIIFRTAPLLQPAVIQSARALYRGVIPPANRRAIISKSYDSHFLSRPRRALKRQWGLLENRLLAFLNLKRAK